MAKTIYRNLGQVSRGTPASLARRYLNSGYKQTPQPHFGSELTSTTIITYYTLETHLHIRVGGKIIAFTYIYPKEAVWATNVTKEVASEEASTGESLMEQLGGNREQLGA